MLKDVIKGFLHKGESYKARFRDERDYQRIQEVLAARKKNANERELERFLEEERQKKIKIALDKYRKERQKEYWKPTSINKGWDSMKSKNNILKQKKSFNNNNTKSNILRGSLNGKVI